MWETLIVHLEGLLISYCSVPYTWSDFTQQDFSNNKGGEWSRTSYHYLKERSHSKMKPNFGLNLFSLLFLKYVYFHFFSEAHVSHMMYPKCWWILFTLQFYSILFQHDWQAWLMSVWWFTSFPPLTVYRIWGSTEAGVSGMSRFVESCTNV